MSKKFYYEISSTGFVIGRFDDPPPEGLQLSIVHAEPPPETMLSPHWQNNMWVDNATDREHEKNVDSQTSREIKLWCIEQGKNEEYYINCGIRIAMQNVLDVENIDYKNYHKYRKNVDEQIKIGKVKKKAIFTKNSPDEL